MKGEVLTVTPTGIKATAEISTYPVLKCTETGCYLLESENTVTRLAMLKDAVLGASGYSNNNMWYPPHVVEEAVQEAQERVKALAMIGEFNHKSALIGLPPDPAEASHVITSLRTVRLPEDIVGALKKKGIKTFYAPDPYFLLIVGDVVFLPTKAGQEMVQIIESGATISFSLRARILDGVDVPPYYKVKKMSLESFDVVIKGGFGPLVHNGLESLTYISSEELRRRRKGSDAVRELLRTVLKKS